MKTRLEWFALLPKKIALNAISAVKKRSSTNYKRVLAEQYSSLQLCIDQSFTWSITSQGHNYWSNVSKLKAYDLNTLPINHDILLGSIRKKYQLNFIRKNDWKFGMEPTFMISPDFIPKSYYKLSNNEGYGLYANFISGMSRLLGNCLPKIDHPWWKDGEFDNEGCCEFPTPTYTNFKSFMKDYEKLVKDLDLYGFVPSSLTCLIIEGGCHINFDLEWLNNMYGNIVLQRFLRNLIKYIVENPWIVWFFLSPEDNVSSRLKSSLSLSHFSKGDFVNFRDRFDTDFKPIIEDNPEFEVDYIELRFFMQPRNSKEMALHYDFALQLMNYILKKSIESTIYPKRLDKLDLTELTLKESIDGMKKVCKTINFPFSRLDGKIELVKQRFAYGKKYLV